MSRNESTPAEQRLYKDALAKALLAGYSVLASGGEAIDAAVAAVSTMEDCPLFNSGKGAVFNIAGKNELEASIMLSKPPSSSSQLPHSRRGFALTLLTQIRNPSQAVRALYLAGDGIAPHTMLSGPASETLLSEQLGFELVDPSYFYTEKRWREHRRGLGLPETPLPHDDSVDDNASTMDLYPTGTVGAVALDTRGCIATVTSTGGKTNKFVGRIGDTPQFGSGFYAEEWEESNWWHRIWNMMRAKKTIKAVGISGTGDGDYFIRQSTASLIAHRVKFLNESISNAASHVVEQLRYDGGIGGVIVLDREGKVAMQMNCSGMYRGLIRADGIPKTAIFNDEDLS